MSAQIAHGASAMGFRDGLGDRVRTQEQGTALERLRLRPELALVPSFEFALRERVSRLAGFKHPSFGRVRSVERVDGSDGLTIVSEEVQGTRLTELLKACSDRGIPFEIGAALALVRQLAPAIATLHETVRDVAHGAIGPERIIVAPNGRPVVVETVLGSALEQLLFSRERYWSELKIALPRMAGLPRFDQLTDVTQVGAVALALLLGRQLTGEEYPARVGDVLNGLEAQSADGSRSPLAPAIKSWLERTLQLDPRASFPTVVEARTALEKAVAESGYDAAPERLERLVARVLGQPAVAPVTPPAAVPPAVVRPQPPQPLPQSQPVHQSQPAPPQPVQPMPKPLQPAAVKEPVTSAHPVLGVQGTAASASREPFRSIAPAGAGPAADAPTPEPARVAKDPFDVEVAVEDHEAVPSGRRWKMIAAAFAAVAVLGGGATVAAMRFLAEPEAAEPPAITGTLVLTSEPSGAEASVDGTVRGATPLTLTLPAGQHSLRLTSPLSDPRSLRVTVPAGGQVAQYVELARHTITPVDAAVPDAREPAAANAIAAGALVDPSMPAAGWISVSARFDVRLFEAGQLIGSSQTEKIMVPAGSHDLEMVSDEIGYRVTKTVQVTAGKVSMVSVEAPNGTLSVNAIPWAEVWIDGQRIGDTPIGNLALPVGSHDVVFKHPELGERQQTVVVTLKSAARITADLSKP